MLNWEIEETEIKLNGVQLCYKAQKRPKMEGGNPYYWFVTDGLEAKTHKAVTTAIVRVDNNAPVEEVLRVLREELKKEGVIE